jgi:lipopolysaccharide transport system permease protein
MNDDGYRNGVSQEDAVVSSELEREPQLKDMHPHVPLLQSPLRVISNLKSNHYLLKNMVKRNLNQRYNRALLGYLWTLLEPALLAMVYYILFIIIANYQEERYPMWILLGVIGWGMFARIVNSTISSLSDNSGMIKQTGFPLEIYSSATSITQLVMTLISFAVVIPFMINLGLQPTPNLWMLPAALIMLFTSAYGVGLIFASMNVVFPDVGHAFRFVTRAGFFVSPVMWTYEMIIERVGTDSVYIDIILLNPVVVPITMIRHSIEGTIPAFELHNIIYAVAFPIMVFVLGTMIFTKTSRGVVKRL